MAGVSTTCRVLHNAILLYNYFPDLPIVYHIHLPTYNYSLCTVSRRAQL